MKSPFIVGIDLGTTHSVVACARGEEPASIFDVPQLVGLHEVEARPLLPSFLYAATDAESPRDLWGDAPWVVGELARRRGREVPGRLVSSAKSWLCHERVDRTAAILPWGTDDESQPRLSPVDASARLLAHIRAAWDAAHPEAGLRAQLVVLTVPASFDQVARELTLQAAERVGLTVRLLEEPQAAFYDYFANAGRDALELLVATRSEASVLVVDVGGGTTDLTLIRVARSPDAALGVTRTAVGRHLLLGGDNFDLALAHQLEARLAGAASRLPPARFVELTLACRGAKERLLGPDAPESVAIALADRGSLLVGSTLRAELGREETERAVLDGFFPLVGRDAELARPRGGLVAFGLPYETDPAITRHVAAFLARHLAPSDSIDAVLLNGGVFNSPGITARMLEAIAQLQYGSPARLPESNPDLAVALGAVAHGRALLGRGTLIGGGSARGYFVGVEAEGPVKRAVCVVPRGAAEGERHRVEQQRFVLRVGKPVRFDVYSRDSGNVARAGEVVEVSDAAFERLAPVALTFHTEDAAGELPVVLEGEVTSVGTLDLSCVESSSEQSPQPRRFRLAFDLRADAEQTDPEERARQSLRPGRTSLRPEGARFERACEALEQVFGKGRGDVKQRAVKDLWRELERLLGERGSWSGELARALFDTLSPHEKSRRRSADHERVFWMLAGFLLRPGYGHPLDGRRIETIAPLFEPGLTFAGEARGWQQLWIAWRRLAGGLDEARQTRIRDRIDPFLAVEGQGGKKPKGFKPQAWDEMLELGAALERMPWQRRAQLGEWLIERSFSDRNPRLWSAIGRLGARIPTYASAHHVVPPRVAEQWVDHVLREKWAEQPLAPRAARDLARVSGDRARDLAESVRAKVERALRDHGADEEWLRSVREHVPLDDRDRAEFFGADVPAGLRLVE
ncbi:MAG: Hsp70 family protein [Polyangiaceae bacterium]|nr:Hsp70 family protein [Polyangiaceae bacterium]